MSFDLSPICVFDVTAKGRTTPAPDQLARPAKGAAYRWFHLDLTDPGLADWVARELPQIAGQTLMAAETRPRIDPVENGLILTLRGVNLNAGEDVEDMVSLRLWVTQKLIVTVRKRRIFAVDDLRQMADAGQAPPSTGEFLDFLCDGLIDRIETVSLALDDKADAMEVSVYDENAASLPELAPQRRQVIKLRRHLGPQLDALTSLARIESAIIPVGLQPQLQENANRAARSLEELSEIRERLTALSDHLDLMQAARLGRNSFTLSVVAAIFLPISFLTGLFGVNLGGIPGAQNSWGFVAFVGVLTLFGVILYFVLRRRRWL